MNQDLRKEIDEGKFKINYKKILNIEGGNIYGLEELIRWKNKEKGMIKKLELISVEEEKGMIGNIGDWVLKEE